VRRRVTEEGPAARRNWFSTTQWSVVLAAGSEGEVESRDALATLCRTYWPPIYSYIRCRGHDAETARDLTQGFFAALLERRGLESARQERGRFRSFLLACVRNFLADERDRATALKLGRGQPSISLDLDEAETSYAPYQPASRETPESLFERRWALTLLDEAMRELETEMARAGNAARFRVFGPYLVSDTDPPHADLARELGITEAAARVALHRMRQRFGAVLREQVARTLDDPARTDDELRYLIGLMGS